MFVCLCVFMGAHVCVCGVVCFYVHLLCGVFVCE